MADSCVCLVGKHPLIEDIDDLLKDGASYGKIREHLISENEAPLERSDLSRHSLNCLKLNRRSPGRPKKEPITGEDVPPLKDVRDLAISLFYQRMKDDPSSVSTRDLAAFATAAMKAKGNDDDGDEADSILEQLGG